MPAASRGDIAYPLDVTDAAACDARCTARSRRTLGPIDLAVLNAGIGASFDIRHFDAEDVNRRMAVNYGGTVNGIGAVLPAMQARGTGRIAMTASVAGYRGLPGAAPYAASKAAMISLAESLYLDLAGTGVDVSVICPGYVTTPLTADNRQPMPFVISARPQPGASAKASKPGVSKSHSRAGWPGCSRLFSVCRMRLIFRSFVASRAAEPLNAAPAAQSISICFPARRPSRYRRPSRVSRRDSDFRPWSKVGNRACLIQPARRRLSAPGAATSDRALQFGVASSDPAGSPTSAQ